MSNNFIGEIYIDKTLGPSSAVKSMAKKAVAGTSNDALIHVDVATNFSIMSRRVPADIESIVDGFNEALIAVQHDEGSSDRAEVFIQTKDGAVFHQLIVDQEYDGKYDEVPYYNSISENISKLVKESLAKGDVFNSTAKTIVEELNT